MLVERGALLAERGPTPVEIGPTSPHFEELGSSSAFGPSSTNIGLLADSARSGPLLAKPGRPTLTNVGKVWPESTKYKPMSGRARQCSPRLGRIPRKLGRGRPDFGGVSDIRGRTVSWSAVVGTPLVLTILGVKRPLQRLNASTSHDPLGDSDLRLNFSQPSVQPYIPLDACKPGRLRRHQQPGCKSGVYCLHAWLGRLVATRA